MQGNNYGDRFVSRTCQQTPAASAEMTLADILSCSKVAY